MDIQLKRGLLDVCVLAAIKSEDSYGYKIIKDVKPYVELSEEEKIALAELGNERETEIRTYVDNYVDPRTNEDRFVRIVNVDIMSGVFIGKPGVYSVTYTVDMDGDYKGYTRLHVVVEE